VLTSKIKQCEEIFTIYKGSIIDPTACNYCRTFLCDDQNFTWVILEIIRKTSQTAHKQTHEAW